MVIAFTAMAATAMAATAMAATAQATAIDAQATITYQYRVVASYPHDATLFTQGLVFDQGRLFESAGLRGRSQLLSRQLESPQPLHHYRLPAAIFAEGLTLFENRLYQLSWQAQKGFIYHPDTLQRLGEFPIIGEGWGISHNQHQLIISNGSDTLQFIDPLSFAVVRTLRVHYRGRAISQLNELEWIDGLIYANIWQSNLIVIIDPHSGQVVGRVSLKGLLPMALRNRATGVLNGIAFDSAKQRLLVTGKNWPRLYHIELIAPAAP